MQPAVLEMRVTQPLMNAVDIQCCIINNNIYGIVFSDVIKLKYK